MPMAETPKIPRWPFFAADAVLIAAGGMIAMRAHAPIDGLSAVAVALCFSAGAAILAAPFLREHAGAVRLWEQAELIEAAQKLDRLADLARQVQGATAHWQSIHEAAGKVEAAARDAVAQAAAETAKMRDLLLKADGQEKNALRFELEKLRRSDAELLQVLVHILDHVHALNTAAARGAAPAVARQLGNFRAACLDTARRVGLAVQEAQPGEAFDSQVHQTVDGKEPPAGHVVAETIAAGYRYQSQGLRRILVATTHPDALAAGAVEATDGATTTFTVGIPPGGVGPVISRAVDPPSNP